MEKNPRSKIEQLIEKGDLEELLKKAAELHGHFCSYLAYGVKAGYIAVKELGIKSGGMEELIALVETNNCFSDGIQTITGCTFGNNGLIYLDTGKTAVTIARRDGIAIRIALDPKYEDSIKKEYSEANNLWKKIVVQKETPTEEQQKRMMNLFAEMAFNEIRKPTNLMFRIKRMKIKIPEYAPIFDSIICPICQEKTYKPVIQNQKQLCKDCARTNYYILDGSGIRKNIDRSHHGRIGRNG